MGRFKLGLYLGGALGASLAWLNLTSGGRKMRDELLDHAAVVYSQVKEKVMASRQWKELTKNQYVAMVHDAVDRYAIQTGLADELKKLIVKVLTTQWENLQREMKKLEG